MAKLGRCPVKGKVQFEDFDQIVRRILINSAKRGVALRPYVCNHCGYWHETSKREYRGSAA